METTEKSVGTSGADENTPSVHQYFSWINNTNEGSTERQTLINLDYFKWLRDEYGMKLQIYAWDAGNLDGSQDGYETPDSPKIKKQFPNGYGPIAAKAAEMGVRMGVWGGADGFGNTPEEEKARYGLLVSLCRDYNFMEFKFDTVCGGLRPEKRDTFAAMINECRKYCPDLIVLNHRNNLGKAEICATTFLWEGVETYIDVHMCNTITGPHHRVCALERGLVPGLKRLTEDHGVCISSCLDFFEDDMVIQAFGRSLILAPEIYGNPWLLRDGEQARLAAVFNLHKKYAPILTSGITLPEEAYGKYAVSRGDGKTRLITLRNNTWKTKAALVRLDEEIGLKQCEKAVLISHYPYEQYIGVFGYGETVRVEIKPFRATLLAAVETETFGNEHSVLTNCLYERTRGAFRILKTCGGPISYAGTENRTALADPPAFDATPADPVYLGSMEPAELPENIEALYEATCFSADNDAFEAQSLKRSGPTEIAQVEAAREAFFRQETYLARGCEAKAMFDGSPDTFFDGMSKHYGTRLDGGCLRIDFGSIFNADALEIEYFEPDAPTAEVFAQTVPGSGEFSRDLSEWNTSALREITPGEPFCSPSVKRSTHAVERVAGKLKKAVYAVGGELRYFRMAEPMDRIYGVRLIKNGSAYALPDAVGNNLMAHYSKKRFGAAKTLRVDPGSFRNGSYLAVALEGEHGEEGAYCAAAAGGKLLGFPDRAGSYPVNNWEHNARGSGRCYTYYLPLTADLRGVPIDLYALFCGPVNSGIACDVYLCESGLSGGEIILPQ